MAEDYCVYWNHMRDQFHVTKTERAARHFDTILKAGLTYTEADKIRQESNESYVKDRYQNYGKDVIQLFSFFNNMYRKWNNLSGKQKKVIYVVTPAVASFLFKKISSKKNKKKEYAECKRPPVDYEN